MLSWCVLWISNKWNKDILKRKFLKSVFPSEPEHTIRQQVSATKSVEVCRRFFPTKCDQTCQNTDLIHKSKGKREKTMNSVTGAECSAAPEGGSFKADGQYTKLLRTLFPSAHSTVNNWFMLSLSYGNWSAVFRQQIYPEKTQCPYTVYPQIFCISLLKIFGSNSLFEFRVIKGFFFWIDIFFYEMVWIHAAESLFAAWH